MWPGFCLGGGVKFFPIEGTHSNFIVKITTIKSIFLNNIAESELHNALSLEEENEILLEKTRKQFQMIVFGVYVKMCLPSLCSWYYDTAEGWRANTNSLGVGEEVARHDQVLAASVQSHREIFTFAVDHLQTLTNALGIRPISVDQLIGRTNQSQYSLLNLLHDNWHMHLYITRIVVVVVVVVDSSSSKRKGKEEYLYSAFIQRLVSRRSDIDHTVLPANYTMPAFPS